MRGGLGPAPTTTHNAVMRLLAGDDAADDAAPAPPRDPLAHFLQPPPTPDLPALRARAAAFLQFAAEADAAAPPVPCSADVDVVGHLKQTADGASRNVPLPPPMRPPAPAVPAAATTAFPPRPSPAGLFSNRGFGSSSGAVASTGATDSLAAAMAAFEAKKAAMQKATSGTSAVVAPAGSASAVNSTARDKQQQQQQQKGRRPTGPLVQEIASEVRGDDNDAADTSDNVTSAHASTSSGALAGLMNVNRGLGAAADILDSLRTVGAEDGDATGAAEDGTAARCVEMNVVLGVLQNGVGAMAPSDGAGFARSTGPAAASPHENGGERDGAEHALCTHSAAAAVAPPAALNLRRPLIAVVGEGGNGDNAGNGPSAAPGPFGIGTSSGGADRGGVLLPGAATEGALAEKKRRDAMALLRLTAALLDHGDSEDDDDSSNSTSDEASSHGGRGSAKSGQQEAKSVVQVLRSEEALGAADDANACG